jgi:hypothetical protein
MKFDFKYEVWDAVEPTEILFTAFSLDPAGSPTDIHMISLCLTKHHAMKPS